MANEKDPNDPSTTSHEYDSMAPYWRRAEALLGGTDAMRKAGAEFAPKHPQESKDNHNDRIRSNVLFNVYELTLDMLTGKAFSRPLHLNDDVPSEIREFEEDIDLQGNNMTTLSRDLLAVGLSKRLAYLLIEFPRTEKFNEDGDPIERTAEDDQRERPRPYWRVVDPANVIFAMKEEGPDNVPVFTHVRIQDGFYEQDGFAQTWVDQIRFLTPGEEIVYRKLKDEKTRKEEWREYDRFATGVDFVPMVEFEAGRSGSLAPPMDALAHLNIRHWQSNSDQINILTVSRFPMLGASGISEHMKNDLEIGPRTLLTTREPNGRFYYVEATGSSIEAGRKDLESLERQMTSYGAQFLRDQPDRPVASGRVLDSAESSSILLQCVVLLENSLQHALALTARWLNLAEGGTAKANRQFGSFDSTPVSDLLAMRKAGDLSYEDLVEEVQARGALSERFDSQKNRDRLAQEKPEEKEDTGGDDDEQ